MNLMKKVALLVAVVRAAETFKNKRQWQGLIKRAMAKDFSWKKSAKEYIGLFETALNTEQKNPDNFA